jgi:adenosylmethionine-8-amino-7-oxononanoate aminotransferase
MIRPLIHSATVCPDMGRFYPKIDRGEGVYLFDQSGKKYLDASSGAAAVANIGHGRIEMANVIQGQIAKISVLPTHMFSSEIVESYLERLVDFVPGGFDKAWTVMSGTEAVENAVKLALQYHQIKGDVKRYKIISRWNTYHGNSVFMLDVGGMIKRRTCYEQWFNNFPHIAPAYEYRKPNEITTSEYVKNLILEFEECLIETGPETVAAFIAEPIVAAAMGVVPAPDGYFTEIKRVCEKYGILYISDEIFCGFGRTGKKFGIEHYGVVPDIIAAGKGISGGYFPLAAIIASSKIMAPFVDNNFPFMGGHTFACNPVGAAVGMKVLDILEEEKLVENSDQMGKLLLDKMQKLYQLEIVGDVRGCGLLCGVEIVRNKLTKEPFSSELRVSKRISEYAIEEGVVFYPGSGSKDGVEGDHILLSPPLVVDQGHLDEIVDALYNSILKVCNDLFNQGCLR